MSEEDDRRKSERYPLNLLVQYRFNTFEDFLAEYTLNISAGGLFIKTEKPYEENAILFLQFSLKDGAKLIEGMGRVVRVNPPGQPGRVAGMGIEFVNFDEASMQLVEEVCAHRAAMKALKS